MKRFLHHLILLLLAAVLFIGGFWVEKTFSKTEVLKRNNQIILDNHGGNGVTLNRQGKNVTFHSGDALEVGDIVDTGENILTSIAFTGDAELRLAAHSKLLVGFVGSGEQGEEVFRLIEGKLWLNTLYSPSRVNLVAGTTLLIPQEGVVSLENESDVSKIYANKSSVLLYLIPADYVPHAVLLTKNAAVLNSLLLAQGTQAMVADQTIKNNLETIKRLLFSKLIKELQYSVFDKAQLETDEWLKKNIDADAQLAENVQLKRLKEMRGRGLTYSSLDSLNYNFAQALKTVFATFTFSKTRLIERSLGDVLVDLHDAEFLYDVGRADEALQRLNLFQNESSTYVNTFGEPAKQLFLTALQKELGFLLFVQPGDSLFDAKTALTDMLYTQYAGAPNELEAKVGILMDKLNLLSYVADKGDAKLLKKYFDIYLQDLKTLLTTQDKNLVQHPEFLQQQNQLLDNLFAQYAAFYRQDYFKTKILLENKYLDLLPTGDDKNEERQTIISQRIDFLRHLEDFFLDGQIPVAEATNIVSLLTLEIKNIELPDSEQVAIAQIFNEKLQDFEVFSRFLNSPEYLTSTTKGKNYRERFQSFVQDQPAVVAPPAVVPVVDTVKRVKRT